MQYNACIQVLLYNFILLETQFIRLLIRLSSWNWLQLIKLMNHQVHKFPFLKCVAILVIYLDKVAVLRRLPVMDFSNISFTVQADPDFVDILMLLSCNFRGWTERRTYDKLNLSQDKFQFQLSFLHAKYWHPHKLCFMAFTFYYYLSWCSINMRLANCRAF